MRDGKAHPRLFRLAAAALRRRGALNEAAVFLRQGLALDPADEAMWLSLGACLARLGELPRAIEALTRGVAAAPGNPDLTLALAEAYAAAGEPEPARAWHRRTLALDPSCADAYAGLATLEVRLGDAAEAQALAEKALALAPDHPAALVALADAAVRRRRWPEAEQTARRVLDLPGTQTFTRAIASALLGEARHGQGCFANAFAAWTQAKALFDHECGDRWREAAALRLAALDRWIAALERRPEVAPGPPPRSPAFLMGFLRSGTTLAGQLIAGCQGVTVLDERPTLVHAAALLHRPDAPAEVAALDAVALEDLRLTYWRAADSFGALPGDLLVDKMPLHAIHLPVIARLFPGARVVIIRRDPRDVVLSCLRRMFRPNADTAQFRSPEGVVSLYERIMRLTDLCETRLGLNVLSLRYEDLVADPEGESRRLAGFLGLDWSPAMLDVAGRPQGADVQTPSAVQLRAGLFDGSGQWRPYAEALAPVLPRLKPWIERFGYPA